jgi:hypothetical protein
MTNYTLQELTEIGKHLSKVREIHDQNADSDRIELDLPDEIALNRIAHGLPLGIIMWSEDLGDYVFAPHFEKEPEPPKWASSIPLPPTRFP